MGSYAPRSPNLSYLSATPGTNQPLAHTPQQMYGQHSRTSSADYAVQYRHSPGPTPNGPGFYHGGPPQHFSASPPPFPYGSLLPHTQPVQQQHQQQQQQQPHMTSQAPPPHHQPALAGFGQVSPPARQLYHDAFSSYNSPPPPAPHQVPPFSPDQHHTPHRANTSSNSHGSPTPPQQQQRQQPPQQQQHQHYNPLHHPPPQVGHSPPQQPTYSTEHHKPSQPPAGYPQAALSSFDPYAQHAAPVPQTYGQTEAYLNAPAASYQAAQYAIPPTADHQPAAPAHSPELEMPPAKPAAPAKEPEIMFSPVKTKFPTARIKRIMQADEEVGKVAQQTPIAVGKALELFMVQLVTKSADVARDRNSKRITAQMLKQVIDSGQEWDFLQDIVAKVTDEREGAKAGTKTKAESESDEEIEPAEPKKRGRTGRKKKGAE